MSRNSKIICASLAILFVLLIAFVIFHYTRDNGDSENQNEFKESCEVMSSSAGLVQGGKISTQEQFPWIAAISKNTPYGWVHVGSGSLISHNHVIVDDRSVSSTEPGEVYEAAPNEWIRLNFGTTKWNDTNEPGAIFIDGADGIEKFVLYPAERNADNSRKLLPIYDLAVIFLKNSI
jgi:hypothetical protein